MPLPYEPESVIDLRVGQSIVSIGRDEFVARFAVGIAFDLLSTDSHARLRVAAAAAVFAAAGLRAAFGAAGALRFAGLGVAEEASA